MNRPDTRSPFAFGVIELGRRPGSMLPVRRSIPIPDDFGVGLVHVPAGGVFEFDGRMESVVEGVVLTGVVRTTLDSECGRCLRAITQDLEVDVCELYAYPDSATDQTTDADEVSRLRDEMIDAEPVIRDAVLLALPTTPLCEEDCPGLCAECGEHWDDLPSDHQHESVDPRWAALRQLAALPQSGDGPADGGSSDSTRAGSHGRESVTEQEK